MTCPDRPAVARVLNYLRRGDYTLDDMTIPLYPPGRMYGALMYLDQRVNSYDNPNNPGNYAALGHVQQIWYLVRGK